MPFDPKSPKKVGKKSKRGPAKKREVFHYWKDRNALRKNIRWFVSKLRNTYQNRKGKSFWYAF